MSLAGTTPPDSRFRGWWAARCVPWWQVALCVVVLGTAPLPAQESAETRAFNAAARAFDLDTFERAEREFEAFVQSFPDSPQTPEAVLYLARAAIRQQKFQPAVELLTTHLSKAGALADRYRYHLGEAYLEGTNYQAAAETFARLIQEYPQSPRLLEASYGEALARFRLQDWTGVIARLQDPQGTFRTEAKGRSADELVARGHVLLGEALFEDRQYAAAEMVLRALNERDLLPEYKWRRQYLLSRLLVADRRPAEALSASTNLLALAAAAGQRNFLAESVALRGQIFEQLNDLEAAILTYTNNLADTVPAERRRQAFLKTIELTLSQDRMLDAAQKLETFFAQYPQEAGSDVALLTLGELHLKQGLVAGPTNLVGAATNVVGATNHLLAALGQFDKLLATFTNSPLRAKAQLNRGWCLWLNGNLAACAAAFDAAAEQLPFSEDQAVARFKLADAQFRQKDFTNALQNYRAVLSNFTRLPRVIHSLGTQALYQILRASLEVGDLPGATAAVREVLRDYPQSSYAERGLLLVGQSYTHAGRPDEARAVLAQFVRRSPESPLRPEVERALARTFVEERQWSQAIAQYQECLKACGTNELRPPVLFDLAWAHYQAGADTNAFGLFTNFIAQFPAHPLAQSAQFWLGGFFYGQKDFVNAEKSFQDVFQKWPVSSLSYAARMMAGRAAFARQLFSDARGYFTNLLNDTVNDTNCPQDIVAEAFFALGDTLWLEETDPNQPLQKIEEARVAFRRIPESYPTNRLVPLAWGRVGDCCLRLATEDSKFYESALEAYQKVLAPELKADLSARCQAEMGLGIVLERQAQLRKPPESVVLLKAALDHYLNIVAASNVRDGEEVEPLWLKEAGLAAGSLAERLQQWNVALKLYERLKSALPTLGPVLDKKIEKVQQQMGAEKG